MLVLFSLKSFAQEERKPVRQGNELYKAGKYDEAQKKYEEALTKKPNTVEALFNKGNVMFQNKDYENAQKQFETVAALSNDDAIKAKAYHNMGNSFLESNKFKESVDAYKNALKFNPNDSDTKYNLAYALQKLKQQQNQQNKDDQNKDKDQNKDLQNKDKDQQQQDNKDKQEQQNKDQKDNEQKGDKGKEEEQKNDGKEEQKPQPKPSQISKEDAQKLLEALKNEEQKVQEKLQKIIANVKRREAERKRNEYRTIKLN
jgi:tetratricopeptide (TPR) repeat protein